MPIYYSELSSALSEGSREGDREPKVFLDCPVEPGNDSALINFSKKYGFLKRVHPLKSE